jgi:hypothetical protein
MEVASAAPAKPSEWIILLRGLQAYAILNFLPLAFLFAFIIAMSWPWLGQQFLIPMVEGVHVM